MSAPFVSAASAGAPSSSSNNNTSSSNDVPNLTTNNNKLYFPKYVPSAETKIENVLLITNNSNAPVIWKMRRSPNTPFLVHPTSGVIHPREERRISITCTGEQLQPLLAAAAENPQNWSEKLQLNARFFHESDNRENVAECWNNKKADAAMKKTKIDLPVLFAEAKNSVPPSHHQQSPTTTANVNDFSTIANDGSPAVVAVAKSIAQQPASSFSQSRQPSLVQSSPQATRPSSVSQPSPRNNNNNNNNSGTQEEGEDKSGFVVNSTTSTSTSLRQEASLQSVASMAGTTVSSSKNANLLSNSSNNNNNSGEGNVAASKPSPMTSVVSSSSISSSIQQQQQQQQNIEISSSSSSSPTAKDKKSSPVEKILLATIPIYVFVPLLLIAFSLGAKFGGGSGGETNNVGIVKSGKEQQQTQANKNVDEVPSSKNK